MQMREFLDQFHETQDLRISLSVQLREIKYAALQPIVKDIVEELQTHGFTAADLIGALSAVLSPELGYSNKVGFELEKIEELLNSPEGKAS